jgi:hypothetical protein
MAYYLWCITCDTFNEYNHNGCCVDCGRNIRKDLNSNKIFDDDNWECDDDGDYPGYTSNDDYDPGFLNDWGDSN